MALEHGSPSAAPNKGIRTIPPTIVTGAILYFMVGTILLLMGASKWPYAPKLATHTSRSTQENGTPSHKVILLGQYEVDTNNSGWDQKPMHCGVDPTNQNHMEIYFGPTITWKNPHVPRFFVSSDLHVQVKRTFSAAFSTAVGKFPQSAPGSH